MKVPLKTPLATRKLAAFIANDCPLGIIIYLEGDLGVGKTTFVRGFLRALGYVQHVKSPTFNLFEIYHVKQKVICHFDLYRLADPKELEYVGIADYFNEDNICLIEWPDHGEGFLQHPDLICKFDFAKGGKERVVEILAKSDKGKKIIKKLENENLD